MSNPTIKKPEPQRDPPTRTPAEKDPPSKEPAKEAPTSVEVKKQGHIETEESSAESSIKPGSDIIHEVV